MPRYWTEYHGALMNFLSGVSVGGIGLVAAGLMLYFNPGYISLPTALVVTGMVLVVVDIYSEVSNNMMKLG